ncbi:MAG TPA: flagellar basal body-associated FliL family protein [Nocardioidaceae bacterium]|nr:flagellar basal body-associated FliL family protein [Nocardioidaceae bacterium]
MSVSKMRQPEQDVTAEEPKKSKKKLVAVGLVIALAAGAYWFVLKPSPSEAEAEPEPGAVVVVEPIQINLAAGHYLKIGLALQASAEAHEDPDGSKALDSAIELFSGMPMEDLALAEDRAKLKKKLLHDLEERYHGEVLDVYFTEFVTQ